MTHILNETSYYSELIMSLCMVPTDSHM